jgi:hypothetical protein
MSRDVFYGSQEQSIAVALTEDPFCISKILIGISHVRAVSSPISRSEY